MTHAIAELEIALDVRKTNEPINRASGDIAQADLEKEGVEDITAALDVLQAVGGIQSTLDALGLALTHHGHTWTMDERAGYDLATSLLKRAGRKIPSYPAATPPEEGWPKEGAAPYIPANKEVSDA